jgi:hypothetical protein
VASCYIVLVLPVLRCGLLLHFTCIACPKMGNPDRPTLDFFLHVTVNAHIFFVGLIYIFFVVDNFELIVGLDVGMPFFIFFSIRVGRVTVNTIFFLA